MDLFSFTEEDTKSEFFELVDGAKYRVTITSMEDKSYANGDKILITTIVNESSADDADVGKKYNMFYGKTDAGRKFFYNDIAKNLFSEADLLSGAVKRPDYIGKSLTFTAKKNGNFFNMRDIKGYDATPDIEGLDEASESIHKAAEDGASDICF